jgi:hypothetical protein
MVNVLFYGSEAIRDRKALGFIIKLSGMLT